MVLIYDKKISAMKDLLPILEKVAQTGRPMLIICRRRRGRSPGDAGGQQAARHPACCCCQSTRFWRSPQSHARRHRHPHRRPCDLRGSRLQAGKRRDDRSRQGQAHHLSTKTTRRSSKALARPRTSRRASPRSRSRSMPRPLTTTRRSCRNVWPSWPAVLRFSRSALPPKWK